jgi:threonine/homoserine/homoserine lactone efflux protein
MPEFSKLILFLIAAWVLLVVPGPAVLYIIARSIDQGRWAGIVSTLGIGVGTLFHVIAAALGVSAVLVSSALAFNIVRYLGAAYLIYLGIRKLLEREELHRLELPERKRLSRIFYQGVLVNLLNPKTALFFFAFLPQFVDVSSGIVAFQIMLLGTIFVVMGLFSDGLWALLAGTVGHWFRGNLHFMRGQRYFAATIFIALGLTTALSGSGKE